jgi:hypothetical protein
MSELKDPQKVLIFSSILYHEDHHTFDSILKIFQEKFEDYFYFPSNFFPMKRYYSPEMGNEDKLKRFFLCGKKLMERNQFVPLKLWATEIEKKFAVDDKRTINWDIGLISAENLLLATGKNFTHRIYLEQGVYADLTLIAQGQNFTGLPWSYADYTNPEQIDFFNYLRQFLMVQQKLLA